MRSRGVEESRSRVEDPERELLSSIEIWPEPSPEEREAILVALARALRARPAARVQELSPWAAAGRREALRARWSGSGDGWGQERLAGW